MSNLNPEQFKPKQKRKIAYQHDGYGITLCPGCYRAEAKAVPEEAADYKPRYNTEFSKANDDYITCTGGCGRTIIGRREY